MANKFEFEKTIIKLRKNQVGLSLLMANIAKNNFLDNFKEQGFDGKKWKEVQRRIAGTKAYSGSKDSGKRTRAILQGKGSGRLRRDVANSVSNGHKNGELSYTLVVDNPYAGFHNDGTTKIPQRQFVGMTEKLNKQILEKINAKLMEIW